MPDLVVSALIVLHAASHHVVIISTAPVGDDAEHSRTELDMRDARSEIEARRAMDVMIGVVVDRALRRGDDVVRVKRGQIRDADSERGRSETPSRSYG
jgi:hypothetical protein